MTSSLVRSLSANWIGQFVSVAVGIVVPAMIIRNLGNETYGVWALIVSLVGQLSLLDLGSRHAVVRLTARLHGEGQDDHIWPLLTVVTKVLTILALMGVVVALGVAWYFDRLFVIPPTQVYLAQLLLVALAIDAGIDLLSGPYSSALGGIERYDLLQLGNSVRMIVNAALVWIALSVEFGLAGVAGAFLLSRLLYRIYLVLTTRRLLSGETLERQPLAGVEIRPSNSAELVREIFSFGIWTSVMILGARVSYQIDLLVIGATLSATAVAAYAVPLILVDQMRSIQDSAQLVLFSRFSRLIGSGDEGQIAALLARWVRYSLLLPLSVGLHLVVFGEDFISLWIGRSIPESSPVLLLLLLPFFISTPASGLMALLLARRHPKVVALTACAEGVLNLILSILLVSLLGIVGVAMGTCIASVVLTTSFVFFIFPTFAQLSGWSIQRHAWIPLVLSPVYALVLFAFRSYVGSGTLLQFVIGNAVPFGGLLMVVAFVLCSAEDRSYLRRRFSGV